jgi:two-component sensor histidine kinase
LFCPARKHAFPGDTSGEVSITGKHADGMLEIRIADNGIGMPPGAESKETETFGLQLIRMLPDQLDGTVEFIPPPGTTVVLRIPKKGENLNMPAKK